MQHEVAQSVSVSKIHCRTTHMYNGKVVVTPLSNVLSCFPLAVSGELMRTMHTHLPSFPLTADFFLPVALCVLPSSGALYRNSTLRHWLRVNYSHCSAAFCQRVLLLSSFFSKTSASLSVGVGIREVCWRKLLLWTRSSHLRAPGIRSKLCVFQLQFQIHLCQNCVLLLVWGLCIYFLTKYFWLIWCALVAFESRWVQWRARRCSSGARLVTVFPNAAVSVEVVGLGAFTLNTGAIHGSNAAQLVVRVTPAAQTWLKERRERG